MGSALQIAMKSLLVHRECVSKTLHFMVWCGVMVWCAVWCHGVVWCGVVCGVWGVMLVLVLLAGCGVVWCAVVCCDVVRCGEVCCGVL